MKKVRLNEQNKKQKLRIRVPTRGKKARRMGGGGKRLQWVQHLGGENQIRKSGLTNVSFVGSTLSFSSL
jgi:hypothetical protein